MHERAGTIRPGIAIGLLLVLLLSACSGSDDDSSVTSTSNANPSSTTSTPTTATTMTVATPNGALLAITSSGGGLQDGLLTLDVAGDRVVWFADRPERGTGSLTVVDLVARWDEFGFVTDPPNTVIFFGRDETETSTLAALTDPVIDAGTGALTFAVTPLGDTALKDFSGPASVVIDGTGATNGELAGTVTDEFGESLPGATITIKTGDYVRTNGADSDGSFTIFHVPPGVYDLAAELGDLKGGVEMVGVRAGETTTLDIELKLDTQD